MAQNHSQFSPINPVYLDHNATTPYWSGLAPKVQEWMLGFGNPSSIHWAGRIPKLHIRQSRESIAELLRCHPLELIFTSGGSEANNLAIQGVLSALRHSGSNRNKIIVSAVEHPSVLKTAQACVQSGYELAVVPVDRNGNLDLEFYKSQLDERVALVSVMFANNETGHVLPIKKMADWAHEKGAFFHTDGVQSLGKTTVDVKSWGVDLASFSAHKFYSLKGCGVLYVNRGTPIESLIHGGPQERKRRAGTENVLSIAGFGAVVSALGPLVDGHVKEMIRLRDLMEDEIVANISEVTVNGRQGKRLCNTSSMILAGVDGETLLMNLDLEGFAVSTGAACSSGSPEPSPVLLAMGLTRKEAQSSLRVSLGWFTTEKEIRDFVETLQRVVSRLRSFKHGEVAFYGL